MQENYDANIAAAAPTKAHPLPYIALVIALIVPIVAGFIGANVKWAQNFFYSVAMLSPVAGMLTAIVALCLGKKRIGGIGILISIIVIALPLSGLAAIVVLLFALTGGTFVMHM